MPHTEDRKLIEIILYVLNKTGGIDFYHMFKILYFAEMKHLAKWGCGIVPDEFHALKYGPVPSRVYSAVKELNHPQIPLAGKLSEEVHFAGEDAPNVLLPNREFDSRYLSKSELEALDQAIEENQSLTFGQLMRKSHDEAWSEAIHKANGTNVISPMAMARVLEADESILEYIEEQMMIETALG